MIDKECNFFQEEKIGIELFAAYLLILNQAKDIKDVFTENTLHHTGSSVAAKHTA